MGVGVRCGLDDKCPDEGTGVPFGVLTGDGHGVSFRECVGDGHGVSFGTRSGIDGCSGDQ